MEMLQVRLNAAIKNAEINGMNEYREMGIKTIKHQLYLAELRENDVS